MPDYERSVERTPFEQLLSQRPDIRDTWLAISERLALEWRGILPPCGPQYPPRPTSHWEYYTTQLLLAREIHQDFPVCYPEIVQQYQVTLAEFIRQMREEGRYSDDWLEEQKSLAAKIHQQFTSQVALTHPSAVSSLLRRFFGIVLRPH